MAGRVKFALLSDNAYLGVMLDFLSKIRKSFNGGGEFSVRARIVKDARDLYVGEVYGTWVNYLLERE